MKKLGITALVVSMTLSGAAFSSPTAQAKPAAQYSLNQDTYQSNVNEIYYHIMNLKKGFDRVFKIFMPTNNKTK